MSKFSVFTRMVQIWSPTVAIALLVFIQSVTSHLEGNIDEFHFTIPDVMGNFDDAVSWCKTNNNSTLAVVNDSHIQTALTQFLDSSHLTSMMYINVKLHQNPISTWYLVNGLGYLGSIGNQDTSGEKYSFNCRLRYNENAFIVEASAPSDFRNYICDFEENRCSNDSANSIVYRGRCYVKNETENLTWYQARERCINNDGDLAKFQPESNIYVPPFNTSWLNKSLAYWVGIRWNDWSWKSPGDGLETIFTWWSNGEPNTYSYGCVCVDPNGNPPWSWIDCDCTIQRQFVCLKKVPIQTTTLMTTPITTTMKPTTTEARITTTMNPVTSHDVKFDNNIQTTTAAWRTTALAAGIGSGGGLILIIVLIVLLVIIIRRRQRRSNGGSESRSDVGSNGEDSYKIQNGLYAAVVPTGKNQREKTDSSSEIVYAAPVFTTEPNSTPSDSNYKVAKRVKETDTVSAIRGQTRSIFPQGNVNYDLYANAKEAS